MLRFILGSLFISTVMVGHLDSTENSDLYSENFGYDNQIDPLITGKTFDDDHLARWKIQNEKFLRCGECAFELQPFPSE